MNYAEYVAILSGDTDLLEKLKMEKRRTTLETERSSFFRGINELEGKIRNGASSERVLSGLRGDITALAHLPGGKLPVSINVGRWMLQKASGAGKEVS